MTSNRSRTKQKQIWLDEEFADRLEKLQAKKRLIGKKVSLGDLSKDIIHSHSWEQIEREILEIDKQTEKNALKIGIKFDKPIGDGW